MPSVRLVVLFLFVSIHFSVSAVDTKKDEDRKMLNQVYLMVKKKVQENLVKPEYKQCASYYSLTEDHIDPKEDIDIQSSEGIKKLVQKYIFRQNMTVEEFSKAPDICVEMVTKIMQEPEFQNLFMQRLLTTQNFPQE